MIQNVVFQCHRDYLFGKLAQNKEYVGNFCNDLNIPFHFACRKWIKNITSYFYKFT